MARSYSVAGISEEVWSIQSEDVATSWRIPGASDHKYSRGVTGFVTGSPIYPGAAILGVGAALATGPGMIRYLGSVAMYMRYPEAVYADGDVTAWVVGSGSPDPVLTSETIDRALADETPIVIDAGALELLDGRMLPISAILTPHSGELSRLLAQYGEQVSSSDVAREPAQWARVAAEKTGATVIHKRAIDYIAAPGSPLYAEGRATHWRGVAGAGDVLAGILGGVLAQRPDLDPVVASAIGTFIHAAAANKAAAADHRLGHPITASDIVAAIPTVLDSVLKGAQ